MNRYLSSVVFFCLVSNYLVTARSPMMKIYKPIHMDAKVEHVANKILDQMKEYVPLSPGCELKINDIYEISASITEVTVYKYDLNLGSDDPRCKMQSRTCTNVKVFIVAPEYCDDPSGECFNLFETNDISCIPDIIVEPPEFLLDPTDPFGPGRDYRDVPNPNNNMIIRQVAQEATKFLYSQIDTSKACPLHLKEVIRAKESTESGIDYELEIQVNTNAADFDCEFVVKNCDKIRVHQPFYHQCPGQRFCLLPVKLDQINCIDIPQIQY